MMDNKEIKQRGKEKLSRIPIKIEPTTRFLKKPSGGR